MTELAHKHVRIVIAEHNGDVLTNLKRILENDPRIVVVGNAADGDEAIGICKTERPDILLTEEHLPRQNGRQLADRLSGLCKVVILYVLPDGVDQHQYLRGLLKAGARDAIRKPYGHSELIGSILSVAANGQAPEERYPQLASKDPLKPRIIAGHSPKGGDGCTTVLLNLALEYTRWGRKVLYLDFDHGYGATATYLNVDLGGRHMVNLLQEDPPWQPEILRIYTVTHEASGLRLIGSPFMPEFVQFLDQVKKENPLRIFELLRTIESGETPYEVIVVDLPHQVAELNLVDLFREADKTLLVVKPSIKSLESLYRFVDIVMQRMQDPISKKRFGVLLNQVPQAQQRPIDGLDEESLKERLRESLELPLLGSLPFEWAVDNGNNTGKQHLLAAPKSPWTSRIRELCEIVLEKKLPDPEEKAGLIARALRRLRGGKSSLDGVTPAHE